MEAKELFDSGNLSGAIDQLVYDVRAHPRDQKSRVFLFELLCFAGEIERAGRQLDAVAQTSGDVKVEMGAQAFRTVLEAEIARRQFFAGSDRTPKFFSEPPPYAKLHIDAVAQLREGKFDELEKSLLDSEQMRISVAGEHDGRTFTSFRDGDDLVGPFLEVFFQSDYYWLPFEQIKRVEIQPPTTLRDLLWTSVILESRDKIPGNVFVPVLYHGSHSHSDDLVKLGRMTDWKTIGTQTFVGSGQRTFFADDHECPVLEIRKIQFDVAS